MEIKDALDVLREAMQDEGYRQGWIANIAMSVYDEITASKAKNKKQLRESCNKGAENSLNILLKETTNANR
jgi:hypothetical protein